MPIKTALVIFSFWMTLYDEVAMELVNVKEEPLWYVQICPSSDLTSDK